MKSLAWKRPADLWACVPYSPGAPHSEAIESGDADAPQFYSDPDRLALDFRRQGWQAGRTDLWHAIWRSVQVDHGAIKGRRHLIILNHSESDGRPGHALGSAVQAARAGLQVVSIVPNEPLRAFCGKLGGTVWAGEPEAAGDLLQSACLNLLARYEIAYTPACLTAQRLKVRAWTSEAIGETTLPIA
jgi:hypothetical protein